MIATALVLLLVLIGNQPFNHNPSGRSTVYLRQIDLIYTAGKGGYDTGQYKYSLKHHFKTKL